MYAMPNNITGVYGIVNYANTVTEGYLILGTLVAIYLICVLSFKSLYIRISDCFMYAGFISFVLGGLLFGAQLLAGKWLITLLVLLIASALWSYLDE